ncbi:olfactory receptor-like protein OLF1 [Dendropsophus ebraccatus]|uniref:olfactory receptor-like protein OLF1 n=1 Tax=Dendropsophus ebraccatus TaxID=150705 RepID=UPI0038316DF5
MPQDIENFWAMDLPINKTLAYDVVLLGFSQNFQINLVLFLLFSIIYLVTVFGNGFMVCVVIICPHLHTPMYFFLSNLAVIDLLISTRTVPKLLMDLLSSSKSISLWGCCFQFYTASFLGETEYLLLALMAYDRYVAICKPLHYLLTMRWSVCYRLLAIILVIGFITTLIPSVLVPVKLCNPNQINHFVCGLRPVLKLSCDSVQELEILITLFAFITILLPFIFILVSYIAIISSILKLHSTGRSKAFSTCSSHVMVVVLLYGTALVIFLSSSSNYTSNQEKYTSVVTLIVIPMLNPLIYSLKNKDVTKIFATGKERNAA